MIEQTVSIATADGDMNTFVVHPERDGPHPLVIVLMDAPGVRETLLDICRRLASAGYYVMLPNLYHRLGVEDVGPIETDEQIKRMFDLVLSTTIPQVMDDVDALLGYADGQAAASPGPAGVVGYCMSGTFAINAAARHPDRIMAAASLYGSRLMTRHDDSPHLSARKVKGEIYVGAAEIDQFASLEMIAAFKADVLANGVNCEVEIYPGAHHGFAFCDRPGFDKASNERHWERLHALFRRNLRGS